MFFGSDRIDPFSLLTHVLLCKTERASDKKIWVCIFWRRLNCCVTGKIRSKEEETNSDILKVYCRMPLSAKINVWYPTIISASLTWGRDSISVISRGTLTIFYGQGVSRHDRKSPDMRKKHVFSFIFIFPSDMNIFFFFYFFHLGLFFSPTRTKSSFYFYFYFVRHVKITPVRIG